MHITLPSEAVVKMDATAERLARETPGLNVTRTDVVRMAVLAFVK